MGGDGGTAFNSGIGSGGAVSHASGGKLTVARTAFSGNTVGGDGGTGGNSGMGSGGAIVNNSGTLTIADSSFDGNSVGGEGGTGSGSGDALGGAVYTGFQVSKITGSTFNENTAGGAADVGDKGGNGRGGAIYVFGADLSVTNSTLVGNMAGGSGSEGSGGAIQLAGLPTATLASVTISGNSVGSDEGEGAGINDAAPLGKPSGVTTKATIISGNTGATNCNRPVLSDSYSLEGPTSGDTSCGFSKLPSADPKLEGLDDNGGPTETQALSALSPAVGAVPVAKYPTKVDQRGEPRPDNGKIFCDVGAYELQGPDVPPSITSATTATFQEGVQGSFTVSAAGAPTPQLSVTGSLPKGITFTDNGDGTASLSGKPADGTAGSYPITIKASNGTPPDNEQSFTLTVQAPPTASIAVPVANATYTQGQVVKTSFTCKEGVGGPGIASCVDQGGRPSGAPLDTASAGKHTFTVIATSSDGLSDKAKVTYRVEAPPVPPLTTSIRSRRALVGGRVAKVRLACNGGSTGDACGGKLTLTRRGRTLARVRFKIASGQTQLVSLRLNDSGMRMLRHAHRHRLRVTATTTGRGGATRTILLKLKR